MNAILRQWVPTPESLEKQAVAPRAWKELHAEGVDEEQNKPDRTEDAECDLLHRLCTERVAQSAYRADAKETTQKC